MEFRDLVKERRSSRAFEVSRISDEQLRYILEAGTWAPSPLNLQPWEFIIIDDAEKKAEIRRMAENAKRQVGERGGPKWAQRYDTVFLEQASVLIVVLVDPKKAGLGEYFGQESGAIKAGSACVQNMMLAATDIGLGSLWFTFFRPDELRSALQIPEELEIVGIIPIGKTRGQVKRTPRKEPKIHHNKYVHEATIR